MIEFIDPSPSNEDLALIADLNWRFSMARSPCWAAYYPEPGFIDKPYIVYHWEPANTFDGAWFIWFRARFPTVEETVMHGDLHIGIYYAMTREIDHTLIAPKHHGYVYPKKVS